MADGLVLLGGMGISVLLALSFGNAYAENPTPFDEWDFDFGAIRIVQNPHDLEEMVIFVPITYRGDMPNGTAILSAKVTNPNGAYVDHQEKTPILEIGENATLRLTHHMNHDGLYTIKITATPPEKPYLGHVFDSETLTFLVEPNGREKILKTILSDSNEKISYQLKDSTSVKYDEMVHAVIALPEAHAFDKITLTNNEDVVREFSVDTQDIYMKPSPHYKDMKVNLVKSGNLLPSADAQDTMQEYVVFYANSKDMCGTVYCHNIDAMEEPEEFPMWMLLFLIGFGIIPIMLRKKAKPSPWGTPYVNR